MAKGKKLLLNAWVRQLVIGFGFLNGLMFSIGLSPSDEIAKFIGRYEIYLPYIIRIILVLFPLITLFLTFRTIYQAFMRGGILGITSIMLAFVAGAIFIADWTTAVIVFVIALAMAVIGFRKRHHKR